MTGAKKKKPVMFRGKPLYRVGDRIYYGNLADKYILVLDVVESENKDGVKVTKKVKIQIMDNEHELGKGEIFRKSEKDNLYKALDLGEYWLQSALEM